MATIYAIKGLLLEEVLLKLLSESGYSAIDNANNDETLKKGASGLEVKGRGWNHQIDAIADFSISPPFSYPIRLLLEAKFYKKNVGIEIVRNAVGVLKDVGEYWIPHNRKAFKPRYHYQYAIFTSSKFTVPAQNYAFAQDVYLIKLENNIYFKPIIDAIDNLNYSDFNGESDKKINIELSSLRHDIRKSFNMGSLNNLSSYNNEKLNIVHDLSVKLAISYMGVLGNSFPVFLTPSTFLNIDDLIQNPKIRICWDDQKWFIVKESVDCEFLNDEDILFSFDLPEELFKLYAQNKILTKKRALYLKRELMSTIQIIFCKQGTNLVSSLQLKLDRQWLKEIRERLQ